MDSRPQHFWPHGAFQQGASGARDCAPIPAVPTVANTWRNDIAGLIFEEASPWIRRIRSDEILLPRYDDHLGFVNHAATAADCTHYCQGSPGWYEHLRNALTIVVHEVAGVNGTALSSTTTGAEIVSSRKPVCEAGVSVLDGAIASGVFTLVLAVVGYTAPATAPLLVMWLSKGEICTCGCRRRARSLLAVSSGTQMQNRPPRP